MPYGDGTGPMGAGPMTGRAMGRCAGAAGAGYAGYGRGRGRGYGRGAGHGFGGYGGRGRGFGARGLGRRMGYGWGYADGDSWFENNPMSWNWTREQQMDVLKRQADYFEAQARELRRRMDSLDQEQMVTPERDED